MKFFRKPTSWAVLALIVVWLSFISCEGRAETIVEVAPLVAYAGTPHKGHVAIMAHERFRDRYDIGVVLLLDDRDINGNRGVEFLRTAQFRGFEAGVGYAFWAYEQPQAWNTNNTFALALGYNRGNWTVKLRHWSTAGTSSRNRGMDMLLLGYRFGR